jgi:hypothetical protein
MYCSELSEKIVISSGRSSAYQALKAADTFVLSSPPVGFILQSIEKCRGRRIRHGTAGSSWPRV